MREIKFRVYHKSSSRMLDWNEFITSYYLNDFMETEKYPRDSSYFKEHYEFWSPLMQFTGLTDNKGKEIYEGDVITQKRSDKPHSNKAKYQNVVMVVSWYDGLSHRTERSFELNPHAVENPSWFNECPKFVAKPIQKTKFTSCAWSSFHDCEVIGNIYVNPELLDIEM